MNELGMVLGLKWVASGGGSNTSQFSSGTPLSGATFPIANCPASSIGRWSNIFSAIRRCTIQDAIQSHLVKQWATLSPFVTNSSKLQCKLISKQYSKHYYDIEINQTGNIPLSSMEVKNYLPNKKGVSLHTPFPSHCLVC